MSFSILETIRNRLAPHHKISCSWLLWRGLVKALRERGRGARRESGAFLLGYESDSRIRIVDFVLYDDLDPHSLDSGIVRFNGKHYGALWELCKKRQLHVVADIHVHPAGAQQSESDRQNPMISTPGHIALILPNFAQAPIKISQVGMYIYQGKKQWAVIARAARQKFLLISF